MCIWMYIQHKMKMANILTLLFLPVFIDDDQESNSECLPLIVTNVALPELVL